eukprot:347582-Alexandrium_andersonii.AAC.1
MSASLVGSEMCIRDRCEGASPGCQNKPRGSACPRCMRASTVAAMGSVTRVTDGATNENATGAASICHP